MTNGYKLVLYGEKIATQRTKERVAADIKQFGVQELKAVLDGLKPMSDLRQQGARACV